MSLYKQFKTDSVSETKGVRLEYGDFRVTVARAGGGNKNFAKVLDRKSKPYRSQIRLETLDPDVGRRIMAETYAESVITNWETLVEGEWKAGVEGPDGALLPFTAKNVAATLEALPDLFGDIQEQAGKVALFRESIREDDSKNS